MKHRRSGRFERITHKLLGAARLTWREFVAPVIVAMIFAGGVLFLVERGIIAESWRDALFDYFNTEIVTLEPLPTIRPLPTPKPTGLYEAAESLGYTLGLTMLEVRAYMPVMCAHIDAHRADFAGEQAAPLHDYCASSSAYGPPYQELIEAICPFSALVNLLDQGDFPLLQGHSQRLCAPDATRTPVN